MSRSEFITRQPYAVKAKALRFVECPVQRLLSRTSSGQAVPRNDGLVRRLQAKTRHVIIRNDPPIGGLHLQINGPSLYFFYYFATWFFNKAGVFI